jgi:tRNA pseudouridine55 synthase
MNPHTDGLILLNKPHGMTSFDALRDIKRILGTGKVGHTGTLDKFAEGLLLVLTGRALKLSKWFTHCDKQYEGTICFGAETETLDPEGAVIANAPLPSREDVEQVIPKFLGEIEQTPPAYSAIHIDGERASALARRGEALEMQKRPVTIFRLELLSWEPPYAKIFVRCSSGTYIRSLARDIALAAGSRAHLTALIRTQVAGFKLGNGESGVGSGEEETGNREQRTENRSCCSEYSGSSKLYPDCSNHNSLLPTPYSPLPFLRPIDKDVFKNLRIPCHEISLEDARKVLHGKPLAQMLKDTSLVSTGEDIAVALFSDGKFIAMIERQDNKWNYGYVYAVN